MSDDKQAVCALLLDVGQAAVMAAILRGMMEKGPLGGLMKGVGIDTVLRHLGPGGVYDCTDASQCQESAMALSVLGMTEKVGSGGGGKKQDPTDVVKAALEKAAKEGTNVVGFPGKGRPPAANDDNPEDKKE